VYKVRQEVMEQLFKVNQPNISLSVPVNTFLPLYSSTVRDVMMAIMMPVVVVRYCTSTCEDEAKLKVQLWRLGQLINPLPVIAQQCSVAPLTLSLSLCGDVVLRLGLVCKEKKKERRKNACQYPTRRVLNFYE